MALHPTIVTNPKRYNAACDPQKPIGNATVIRLITIDLDDTLWECEPVILRAEQAVHDWLATHFPRITRRYTVAQMRERRLAMRDEDPGLRYDFSALRRASLAWHAREAGYAEQDVTEPALEVFLAARHDVCLFDDVRPALLSLRRRYTVAALTNGNADVERLGLTELFDFALNPAVVGTAKPDPAMFHAACERAGVERAAAVHVGDSPQQDMEGARAAGMGCVWINRSGMVWDHSGAAPDAEIRDLSELEPLLARWHATAC